MELTHNPIKKMELFIKERMKKVDICQIEMSLLTGIAKTQLNEIIKGKRKLSALNALKIALCINTTPEKLLSIQIENSLRIARKLNKT